jgi:hypothetical protein
MKPSPFLNERIENELICENYKHLDKNYRCDNLLRLNEYCYVPEYYKDLKKFDKENEVLFPEGSRLCDKYIVRDRGSNNVIPTNIHPPSQPFLLPYCKNNTYENHLICDKKKCCSKSHQLFMNHTKRNTGTYKSCN